MVEKKAPVAKAPADRPDQKSRTNGATFLVAALDMSWRLAIVVLVPIVGGFYLDKLAGTSPALVIIGFLLAMAGLGLTMRWALKTADKRFNTGGGK